MKANIRRLQRMLTKKVKKLWQGKFVSIRDYELKKAVSLGGLRIEHGGQAMELLPDQLRLYKPKGAVHQSNFGGQYQLADIEWKPATHDPRQGGLL